MMSRWAFGQATPSMQSIAGGGRARVRKKKSSRTKRAGIKAGKKRRTAVRASKIAKTPKRRRPGKKGKLTKGSPAAKAYMAKIRKMRK